jgi:glycosyltransferase involved in cell wall biosynthesis
MIQHNAVNEFTPAPDDQVAQLRHSFGIESDTWVLLTVGRLSREKGHSDLIDAVALVRKEDRAPRKLKLIIVGDGPERQRLTNQVRRLALENYVVFTGHQPDVSGYYTLADVMVLPSHTEGSPNALLEAMAAGLPIIATAVGGMPEIVGPKRAAFLVQKQDPHAIARAINQLLSHDVLRRRLSQAARSEAKIYSPPGYCQALLSLYQNCLDEGAISQP